MTFTTPLAFVLLLSLPMIFYIGWPRQRYRRARDITSLVLRTTIISLLVLAMAGVQVVQSADRLAVIFLIDASDSVGPVAIDNALDTVREALDSMGENDEVGVVLFGADAQVQRVVNDVRDLGPIRAAPETGNTDIAGAVRLALALFPSDAARRIVLMSDGIPTLGDSEAAAQLAAASGVEISYVPLEREAASDAWVSDLDVPATVPQGQQFDLNMTIMADQTTPARIDVFAGGELIASESTTLRAGSNNRTLTLEASSTGFRDIRVDVEPEGADGFYQNNSLATFSQVVGPARVLLVGGTPEDSEFLAPALEETGLTVDIIRPEQIPSSVASLAQYESIILANVPATPLTNRRMLALQTYVRDLGGGLVVVGGPDAYGPGGYFQTPLEDALPVEMQLKDQQRLPQLTIAYVIDRSGSMSAIGADGVPHIELAKSAINRSIDLLQPTDRAAIVTFDAVAYYIAQFQAVQDRRELQRLVGTLRASGGTDVLSGLNLIAEDIINEPSQLKHIILLTDGLTNPTGLVPTTARLFQQNNVTTTTIAIGGDSNAQLMEDMANAGGGNFHVANDIASVPTIFAQETVLATRSYIFEEESFVPSLSSGNPIMQGITALPQLRGYVGTTPKPASQVVLRGPEPYQDPILSAWQYGLGRSVAFTSDATARWGVNWVTWDNFSRFWNQAVRWTITEGGSDNLETRVVMEDEQARVIVNARDADGDFLNGLDLQTSVVDPNFENERVPLRQVAPGRYEAIFDPAQEGAYLLRINGEGQEGEGTPVAINQTTGWVMSYSPEYLSANSTDSVLLDVAEITGGQSFATDITEAFNRNIEIRTASAPLWPWLLLAAMLLLPIDIAVRRLIITGSDLRRARAALFSRRQLAAEGPTERMTTLFDARDRARQQTDVDDSPNTVSALRNRRGQSRAEREKASSEKPAEQPKPAEQKPRYTPKPPASTPSEGGNLGSTLLKRRRERDQDE